ncbi:inositol monophosphatase family protein [Leifsonia sp. F6_8S_P_1B]|uniref:Inositol-1-monophosphatase n=1 Tax=Leifsonia williamsii TaxID=3035919 RepID=A0ABT8KCL3_9MICO|nr:inositol monophosphatase family protein [Leifsonia williamsii]MDN4614069.1 inositol monophosphatase family protein [Leifsonia williamsii]
MPSNVELQEIAVTVARRAAVLAFQRRRDGVEIAASKSSIVDIVTRADQEAERLIRDAIAAARPRDGFLGEESGAGEGTSGLTWVVDPIDGTVNYYYGIPAYAVSIAVVEGDPDPATWTALAGAVVNPETKETFAAAAGHGATLNGTALHVNLDVELPLALVGTGFGYDPEVRVRQAAFVHQLIGQVRDIRRAGAASLDLCSVAAGRLDAYYERGLNPWDHAAGALIAAEAGARVGGLDGTPAGKRLLLAAAPELYDRLHPMMQEYFSAWE